MYFLSASFCNIAINVFNSQKSDSKENLTQKNTTSASSNDFASKDPISTIMSPKAERYVRRWLTDASPLGKWIIMFQEMYESSKCEA